MKYYCFQAKYVREEGTEMKKLNKRVMKKRSGVRAFFGCPSCDNYCPNHCATTSTAYQTMYASNFRSAKF